MRRDPVLRLLLIWVTLLSVIVWLPLVRGPMNGESYQWSLVSGVGGHGVHGDYWMLIVALIYVLALEHSGRRGPRLLFPVLLLPLFIVFDGAVLYAAWKYPEALRFEGATFGVDVSLALFLPLVFTLFVVLAVWWTLRRARSGGFGGRFGNGPFPWTRRNWVLLGIAAALLPVQFVLFRFGGDSGNQFGVMLTLIQWFVLNTGLNAPRAKPEPAVPGDMAAMFPPP